MGVVWDMNVRIEERRVNVGGLKTHYLTGGEGLPLVLLHGDGSSALVWQWVLPALARTHRVYAPDWYTPDVPSSSDDVMPHADYSPAFYARFVAAFLDAVRIERMVLVGHSLGGLIALHMALSDPARVAALGLVDSSGLGRAVNPLLALETAPGVGELALTVARTPLGAAQRVQTYVALNNWRPERVPRAWLGEMYRLSWVPGFLEATLASKRGIINPSGQWQVVVNHLPRLMMPTLIIWGTHDLIVPFYQGQAAVARLPRGRLAAIPDCGHESHVERPDHFIAALSQFLVDAAPAPASSTSRPTSATLGADGR